MKPWGPIRGLTDDSKEALSGWPVRTRGLELGSGFKLRWSLARTWVYGLEIVRVWRVMA